MKVHRLFAIALLSFRDKTCILALRKEECQNRELRDEARGETREKQAHEKGTDRPPRDPFRRGLKEQKEGDKEHDSEIGEHRRRAGAHGMQL